MLYDLRKHTAWMTDVAFTPSGGHFISVSYDEATYVWSVETGAHVHTYAGHLDYIFCIDFSPTEPRFATGSWDFSVLIWNRHNY